MKSVAQIVGVKRRMCINVLGLKKTASVSDVIVTVKPAIHRSGGKEVHWAAVVSDKPHRRRWLNGGLMITL